MRKPALRNDQDLYRRIEKHPFEIEIDEALATGDAAAIANLQRLLGAVAEAYEIGFEDGEHYITSNVVPLAE